MLEKNLTLVVKISNPTLLKIALVIDSLDLSRDNQFLQTLHRRVNCILLNVALLELNWLVLTTENLDERVNIST